MHNFYGSSAPSGENIVFEMEKNLLLSHGHQVAIFSVSSDEIRSQGLWGLIKGGLLTPWNPFSIRSLKKFASKFKPDIIHVHNTFPMISPSIFHAIKPKIPMVLTLHNYRLFCSAGIPMRNGKACTECLERRSVIPALLYGCYRKSRLATIPLAISITLHHALGTWLNQVDAYIVFTKFQKSILTASGLPQEKIYIKPNFNSGESDIKLWSERLERIVYVGRLSSEKGLINLLKAWKIWSSQTGSCVPTLRIIGDGPLRYDLENMAKDLPIVFLGQLTASDAKSEISMAKLLILPSECYEGFPMVIGEAYALGTPVAASNLGPLGEIVEENVSGVLFEPASPDSICKVIKSIWGLPEKLEALGQGAYEKYQHLYSEKINYQRLIEIYMKVINETKSQSTQIQAKS